jgi:molybdopterin molybdotransferase
MARKGVEPVDLGVVGDDPATLERTLLDAAAHADAIVSSGGVSMGEADFTRSLMQRLGEVTFWTVAMRPGRPLAFGRIGQATYFGLPGNPVAALITYLFFARDGLLAMAGARPRPLPTFRVRSAGTLQKRRGRTEYQRGVLRIATDGVQEVALTGQQGSGMLRSVSQADCIIVLNDDQETVQIGDPITVIPLRGLI